MMRHQYSLMLGLATLFVLPGTLPGAQEPTSLEQRLEVTIEALERLGGIERRIHAGEEGVLQELLRLTEPPLADPIQRDATLAMLRTEVATLQQRWDELSSLGSPLRPGTGAMPAPTDEGSAAQDASAHTGLDGSAYANAGPLIQPHVVVSNPDAARVGSELRSYESSEGFTADARRMGRLLARTKRWDEALELLLAYRSEPDVQYWIARCYEGLNRRGEAIELLQALVAAGQPDPETGAEAQPDARSLARRATYDLRFLELRRELKLDSNKETGK